MGRAAWLAAALLLAALVTTAADRDLLGGPSAAIVNGVDAPRGRFRYMCSLRDPSSGAHFCGGSLIHPQVVLTAAHCAVLYSAMVVRCGGYHLTADDPSLYQQTTMAGKAEHPQYKRYWAASGVTTDFMNNDVALIKLKVPFNTLPTVKIVVPRTLTLKPHNPVPDNTTTHVIGWGAVDSGRTTLAGNLQMLDEKLLPLSVCQKYWSDVSWGTGRRALNNFKANSMICAGKNWPKTMFGFCAGDSGGPQIVQGASAAADTQIGVVSWGNSKCGADDNTPYVYTDLGMVFSWINQTVKSMTGQFLGGGEQVPAEAPTGTNNGTGTGSGAGSNLSVAANPVMTGFNDKKIPLTGSAGQSRQLAQHAGKWSLHGRLGAGPAPKSVLLDQLTWKWSKSVVASVNAKTRALSVTSNGKAVAANGASVAIPNGAFKLFAAVSGTPRRLELVVTGVMLRIEQPWSVEEGKWAPWLNVELTLTQKPTKTLVGALGATLPATTGAWQARKGVISFAPLVRRRAAA